MKQQKKHTQKQEVAALQKENQRLFGLMIQLSQEIQQVGQMCEVTLNIVKQLEDYDNLVVKMKEKLAEHEAQLAQEAAAAEASTQETSTSTAPLDYGDEGGLKAVTANEASVNYGIEDDGTGYVDYKNTKDLEDTPQTDYSDLTMIDP